MFSRRLKIDQREAASFICLLPLYAMFAEDNKGRLYKTGHRYKIDILTLCVNYSVVKYDKNVLFVMIESHYSNMSQNEEFEYV